jgi:site-specific recombinase XerD
MVKSRTESRGRPFERGIAPPNKGRRFPPEIVTAGEALQLIRAPSNRAPTGIRNRALLVVMYRGGLRIGEALALKPADVDCRAGTVRVMHGKGDRSRVVGLDPGAMAVLEPWMERRAQLGIRTRALFCTLDGSPLDPSYVRKLLARLAGKAGIEKRVNPHALRHSHAAELAAEGVPVNVIQGQLGHANLAVTDRYLRHVLPVDQVAAALELEELQQRGEAQARRSRLVG